MISPQKIYEEEAVVLDFLPEGYVGKRSQPIVQALGVTKFTLLELAPAKNVMVGLREVVSIQPNNRNTIDHVIQRIKFSELTNTSENELDGALDLIIMKREKDFVEFLNLAEHVNIRLHKLELLPGVGNKLMWDIINARKVKPFADLKDFSERAHIGDPKKMFIKRIKSELQGNEKYFLFTRKPKTDEPPDRPPSRNGRYGGPQRSRRDRGGAYQSGRGRRDYRR
ncbi:MAG: DUF655 domain-containing protein [Candidatus Ranarchaeia archaeon]|jgi:putative nucleotide binding protein